MLIRRISHIACIVFILSLSGIEVNSIYAQAPEATTPPQAQEKEGPLPVIQKVPTDKGADSQKSPQPSEKPAAGSQAVMDNQSVSDDWIIVDAVGDVMLGSTWPDSSRFPPNDGAEVLVEAKPILKTSDVAFGNLEGPMLEGGTSQKCPEGKPNCYAFRVPTRFGKLLKDAGFSVMGLANNHILDFGQEGRKSTIRTLDSYGIAHTGEVGDIARLNVKGIKIAVIAFSPYDSSYNFNNLETARKVVSGLSATSDIVIVSFHGGAEGAEHQHVPNGTEIYLGENRGDLRRFTHAMIDAGADLLIGQGPHIVRGMEIYKNRLIAYSLGNFATYGSFTMTGPQGLSLILEAKLAKDGKFLGGRIYPFKQVRPGGPKFDPDKMVITVVKQLSDADFGTSAIKLFEDGVIAPE